MLRPNGSRPEAISVKLTNPARGSRPEIGEVEQAFASAPEFVCKPRRGIKRVQQLENRKRIKARAGRGSAEAGESGV